MYNVYCDQRHPIIKHKPIVIKIRLDSLITSEIHHVLVDHVVVDHVVVDHVLVGHVMYYSVKNTIAVLASI